MIEGVSGGSGESVAPDHDLTESLYPAFLDQCLEQAGISFSDLSFFNTHSGGYGHLAEVEAHALARYLPEDGPPSCILGWTAGTAGDTRGVSGLISVIHTALCLNHRTLSGFLPGPGFHALKQSGVVMPDIPVPWPETSADKHLAATTAITRDGCAGFCLLGSAPDAGATPTLSETRLHPSKPAAGPDNITVFTTRPPIPGDLLAILNPHPSPGQFTRDCNPEWLNLENLTTVSGLNARAHEKFLSLSQTNMDLLQTQFAALTRAAGVAILEIRSGRPFRESEALPAATTSPAFTRNQCMEFAVGRAGRVLGPEFDIIDTYPVRVRLPDAPLMLVDRIMAIDGTPCSLGPGKIITQHDVVPGAWYLDGGAAPVSISIEAGQADLFLCSYLGIDHVVQGRRRYRLLDAKVTFHRPLPIPGETIEYHICIDRFLRQGEVILFFFITAAILGTGCSSPCGTGVPVFSRYRRSKTPAGSCSKQDREPVRSDKRSDIRSGTRPKTRSDSQFKPLVPVKPESFDDNQVRHLRHGNLAAAFGSDFAGITLGESQRLPDERMHLIDRVLSFDPTGGRYGLGTIVAEADIHPDAWFLTCHFIDDPVMPGTLMYECCAHALRIFVQRMGWVTPDPGARFDVLPKNESDLKCRGPVTPATQKARYEIDIKQMGYTPDKGQPFVIADAHMFADDLRIVLYKDMGMTLNGVTLNLLRHVWSLQ